MLQLGKTQLLGRELERVRVEYVVYQKLDGKGKDISLHPKTTPLCTLVGATENAGVENAIRAKLQGWKVQEWKIREQIAGVENAGVEITAPDRKGGKCRSGKCESTSQGWKMQE